MSKNTKILLVILSIIAVIGVLLAAYKINQLTKTVGCLYIPVEVTNPYCLEIR